MSLRLARAGTPDRAGSQTTPVLEREIPLAPLAARGSVPTSLAEAIDDFSEWCTPVPRDGLPPKFKPWQAPKPEGIERKQNSGRYRISPRKRGYGAIWDRASMSFRRSNPFCLFCMQERPEEMWETTAVTDHVLPAHEFPEIRLKRSNWIPLCSFHHDSTKAKLEAHARKHGCLEMLVGWVRYPMTRPAHLRPIALAPGWAAIAAGMGWSELPAS